MDNQTEPAPSNGNQVGPGETTAASPAGSFLKPFKLVFGDHSGLAIALRWLIILLCVPVIFTIIFTVSSLFDPSANVVVGWLSLALAAELFILVPVTLVIVAVGSRFIEKRQQP